jgi:hypothetical protein
MNRPFEIIYGDWIWNTTATSQMGALSKAAAVYTFKERRLGREAVSETVRAFKRYAHVLGKAIPIRKRKKFRNPEQMELSL